ncbi:unnamed protein product [Hermetia illucens]|uniref:Uncharacterized protein n=1 Tax=Hermetia illucens TaxID=343691 RepID=A0A7R8YT66_HERIL|nr:unnamed protein product [Hermetia illucens]
MKEDLLTIAMNMNARAMNEYKEPSRIDYCQSRGPSHIQGDAIELQPTSDCYTFQTVHGSALKLWLMTTNFIVYKCSKRFAVTCYKDNGSNAKSYGGGQKKSATSPEMVRKVKM